MGLTVTVESNRELHRDLTQNSWIRANTANTLINHHDRFYVKYNPFYQILKKGVLDTDDEEILAQKKISVYSSILILVLALAYMFYVTVLSTEGRYRILNLIFAAVVSIILATLIIIYMVIKSHIVMRAAFLAGAWIYPLLYSLSHGCSALLYESGTIFMFFVPSTAVFLLAGGSNLYSKLALTVHLLVFLIVHIIEYSYLKGFNIKCPSEARSGILDIGSHLMGNAVIMIVGICTAILCILSFKKANDNKQNKLTKAIDLATKFASAISDMDLDLAKSHWNDDADHSSLEIALFEIVKKLEQFKPYLPDSVFSHENEGSGNQEVTITQEVTVIPLPSQDSITTPPAVPVPVNPINNGSKKKGFDLMRNVVREREVLQRLNTISIRSVAPETIASTRRASVGTASVVGDGPAVRSKVNLQTGFTLRMASLMWIDILRFNSKVETSKRNLNHIQDYVEQFMTVTIPIIKQSNGVVLLFDGGHIFAGWNASSKNGQHGKLALDCALKIRKEVTERLPTVQITISVVTDQLIVGNIGTISHKQFLCLGRGLKLLKNLSILAKRIKVGIICSDEVRHQYSMEYNMRGVDVVRFDGKRITVYEVISGLKAGLEDEWMYVLEKNNEKNGDNQLYDQAFKSFHDAAYEQAKKQFSEYVLRNPTDMQSLRLEKLCSRAVGWSATDLFFRDITECVHMYDCELKITEYDINTNKEV